MGLKIPRIVLTGGPGGGKTTFLHELRREDPERERFVLVPEAATILIGAGHLPGTQEFQLAVVRLQRTLEETCVDLAKAGQALVCDRGVVDSLAYWLLIGGAREEFFTATGVAEKEFHARYDGAIHLRTAALGAGEHYRQDSQGARMENPEEAVAIDRFCTQVWRDHPHYYVVENTGEGWREKAGRAKEMLNKLIL